MSLLRVFDSRTESIEAIARKIRRLSRFDVLEAEASAAGQSVREIIAQVRRGGDAALCELSERFDGVRLEPASLRVPPERIERAGSRLDESLRGAIRTAIENVRLFQEHVIFHAAGTLSRPGVRMEARSWPLKRAGIYVPAGAAPLPSTVIHCAVPAQAAGVDQIVMASPPAQDGEVDETILATAWELGITEIYRLGGAQAIAALALGTETIRPVQKIVGPGNIYAQLAKKMLYGVVDIDAFAGPSEVLVIADGTARPEFVAADLLAQAEHNPGQAVLVTPVPEMPQQVSEAIERHLANLPTAEAARKCLRDYAAAVRVRDLDEAAEFAEAYAPEHLQIETEDPQAVAERIQSAGAVFLGHWTPESLGDYLAGPSHVLPTGGTARFFSGLSAMDFVRRSVWMQYDRKALEAAAAETIQLAEAEGLAAHALAAKIRIEKPKPQ